MDRREFLHALAALTVLPVAGCDGGPTGDDTGEPADDTGEGTLTCVIGDGSGTGTGAGHSHTVTIPEADVEDGVGGTYTSSSSQAHTHEVTLTDEEMATLRDDCQVEVTTTDEAHEHTWTITLPED